MSLPRRIPPLFALVLAAGCAGGVPRRPPLAPPSLLAYDRRLSELLPSPDRREVSLRVEKVACRLTLLYRGRLVKSYPAVFGGDPVNDKRREGDRRTPEGTFRVRALYPHARWRKFLWLDYPTADSWRRHREAKRRGEIPAFATIGGELGIHGVPKGCDGWIDARRHWTLGCISLKNADVDEIYHVARAGMKVEIVR